LRAAKHHCAAEKGHTASEPPAASGGAKETRATSSS
jgi:hypothetical protein